MKNIPYICTYKRYILNKLKDIKMENINATQDINFNHLFDENGNPRSNNYQVDIIPDNRDISKFDSSEKSIANNIRKCVQIPGILIDFEFSTGITVSGAQLKISVSYYNDLIHPKRDIISDSLAEIFENSTIKFPSDDFSMVDFSMNYVE